MGVSKRAVDVAIEKDKNSSMVNIDANSGNKA